MGSDRHYPEEAPPHLVNVDGFWIDRTPVTNREFRKFVNATGYITFAEIAPDPKGYPGALPHVLKAGSLAFTRSPRSISATGASGGISSSVPTAPSARAGQTVPAGHALARVEIRAARQILGPGQLADLAAWNSSESTARTRASNGSRAIASLPLSAHTRKSGQTLRLRKRPRISSRVRVAASRGRVARQVLSQAMIYAARARHGIVRLNSILPARAPRWAGAPLFSLTNCRRARPGSTPKTAYFALTVP